MAKVKKKVMKKNLFVAAAMMVAMTACVKEADVNVDVEENVPQTEEKVWVEFTAGVATKAELNGTVVTWEEDDLISINGVEFAIPDEDGAISADAKTAKFKAEVNASFLEAESFTAVYPASAVVDENIVVPAEQDGTANVVAVATVSELGAILQFRHLTSFFKFQVPAAVTEITISADETLVGTVNNVVYDETISYSVVSGDNTITLTGGFVTEKTYYAAVLPGTKTNLTVSFDGVVSKKWANPVEIEYGMIANMGSLPYARVSRNLEFSETTASATYGEDFTEPTLEGVKDGVEYTSSNAAVATVNATTGEVTLKGPGETTITATAPANETHFEGSASYTLTVTPDRVRLYINAERTYFEMKIYYWGDGISAITWPGILLTWDDTKKQYYHDFPLNYLNKEVNFVVNVNGDECKTKDLSINLNDYDVEHSEKIDWEWIYLKPHDEWFKYAEVSEGWYFAAYFFTNGETWVPLKETAVSGYYGCKKQDGKSNVIFTQMYGNKDISSGWGAKKNQTVNLDVPTGDKNVFVMDNPWNSSEEWKATGTWSTMPQ